MTVAPLLEVSNLNIAFKNDAGGVTPVVTDVSFSIGAGRTLGIVGESGCGKSVTSLAIMGLLPHENACISGSIIFEGRDLLTLRESEMRHLRGNRLAMIFQEPMTSLNPSYTIGDQIGEVLTHHEGLSKRQARFRAIELLREVRIPAPERRVDEYPHKLSGGMRQRAMIAMALACRPVLLIADEPTTALDVTIQAQVLDLLHILQTETEAAILLITHDLGVVAETCDEVAVMYAGQIVEMAPVAQIFAAPEHPYTVGLFGSLPTMGQKRQHLATIPGTVPTMVATPKACRFAPRCPFAIDKCRAVPPSLAEVAVGHSSRCLLAPLERLVS